MTPERFRALLEAHGADFRRWPAAERAAGAMLAQDTPALRALLIEAAGLDDWLDSHAVPGPDAALSARIAAAAPRARSAPWWLWPGAGLAGVGLAGSLAGALAVSVALRSAPRAAPDWPERGTAFTELSADWSEE